MLTPSSVALAPSQIAQKQLQARYIQTQVQLLLWPGTPKLIQFNRFLGIPRRKTSLLKESHLHCDSSENTVVMSAKSLLNLIVEIKARVFILCGPKGSGKTVQMKKVCVYWANQYTLREFPLALYINMTTNTNCTWQESVHSMFYNDGLASDIVQWIEHNKGEGVLFILDGYTHGYEQDKTLLHNLLSADSLTNSKFIVTTTSSVKFILKAVCIENVIPLELLGLSDTQIAKQAVVSLGPDQAGDFLLYLSENPVIKTLVSSPMYLAAVIYVFTHVQPDQLPKTWTQFFASLTFLLALSASGKELKLPNGFTTQTLVQCIQERHRHTDDTGCLAEVNVLHKISHLSFKMLNRGGLMINQEQFFPEFFTSHDILHTGEGTTRKQCYTFTVALLQEFLASLWIYLKTLNNKNAKLLPRTYSWYPYILQFHAGVSTSATKSLPLLGNPAHEALSFVGCLYEAAAAGDMNVPIQPTVCDKVLSAHSIHQICQYASNSCVEFEQCYLEGAAVKELVKCLTVYCPPNCSAHCAITVLRYKKKQHTGMQLYSCTF